MWRRLVRVGLVVVVLSALFAGSAIAANPSPAQFPLVPDLVGTVRDLCTGLPVAGVVASLSDPSDPLNVLESPSTTTSGGFVFQNITSPNPGLPPDPNLVLHVSAPGYDALGDLASPNPGVPITKAPGPGGRLTKQPGPTGLPGETRVFEGVNVAIGLFPSGLVGCGHAQHLPKVTALSGKVFDLSTGQVVTGVTVGLAPEPDTGAVVPGPISVGTGTFKETALGCGAYNLTLQAAGYQSLGAETADVIEQGCGAPLGDAAIAWGNTVDVALAPTGYNQTPVIDAVTASTNTAFVGSPFALSVSAHDPDPGDTLTYQWIDRSGAPCVFDTPNAANTNATCNDFGAADIEVQVSDNHGATATNDQIIDVPANSATVIVTVHDTITGLPIPNAQVYVTYSDGGSERPALTDANGVVTLTGERAGIGATIHATFVGPAGDITGTVTSAGFALGHNFFTDDIACSCT
jgi:hypothetical protein